MSARGATGNFQQSLASLIPLIRSGQLMKALEGGQTSDGAGADEKAKNAGQEAASGETANKGA